MTPRSSDMFSRFQLVLSCLLPCQALTHRKLQRQGSYALTCRRLAPHFEPFFLEDLAAASMQWVTSSAPISSRMLGIDLCLGQVLSASRLAVTPPYTVWVRVTLLHRRYVSHPQSRCRKQAPASASRPARTSWP